ncbi:MAG: hypothetical protein ACPGO3_00355 [Magnetospiraceae bacterium]
MTPEAAQAIPEFMVSGAVDIPDVLLPYQQQLLATTAVNRVTVCEKSRRIGVTWAIGADAVLTSAAARNAGGMDTMYIGYNLDMAREFIDTCAMWAKAFNKGASAVEEFIFKDRHRDGDKDIQAFRVSFASGFEIVALTSNPRSLRGRQGYLIFDEAAFHDDLAGMLKAAMAFLIWGGKLLVISTHDGEENPFAELVDDIRSGRKPYALARTTFDDAVADGLYERVAMILKSRGATIEPKTKWVDGIYAFYGDDSDEELRVIPASGSGAFLTRALIEARMQDGIPVLRWSEKPEFTHKPDAVRTTAARDWWEENILPEITKIHPRLQVDFGMDFGRIIDLSVFWPLVREQNLVRRTPFVIEMRGIPFQQQEQIVTWTVEALPRFGAGAMDARGNGQYLAERMQQKFGEDRVEAVMLSEGWYREQMPAYKAAFEDGNIILPKDADILDDHRAFKKIRGVARIPDQRTTGADKGKRHGDSGIAGALADYASRKDVHPIGFTSCGESLAAAGAFGGRSGGVDMERGWGRVRSDLSGMGDY